ncbi:MAG: DNA methyltransferase [Treponemataceae bacterium]|nr:DNA methyltransferase [Spirochaetales bacterium]MDY6031351.1 DNA methyltransferase [Treponemataceae bacterium]
MEEKVRGKNNRTLQVTKEESVELERQLLTENSICSNDSSSFLDKIINADIFKTLPLLPDEFADLIIIDPPYNLSKDFGKLKFSAMKDSDYDDYLASWLPQVCKKLKKNGSLYLCGDWKCTSSLQSALSKELEIINRITWQREKGRGSKSNWKNGMEDIWFAVKNPDKYTFNIDDVMIKRKVIAPYRENGKPKDWQETDGGKFRLTHPSNFWDDISIPFWSMSENTDHPTQKSEKLYAKLILASSNKEDVVFDPFLGSGTSAVTAKKLDRHYVGVEINTEYCIWAQKRLNEADIDKSIQGYADGVFWERNSQLSQKN